MRHLYHAHGCRFVDISRDDKRECGQCAGTGTARRFDDASCSQCNGHGWLWDNGDGYAFKPFTLQPVYN